MTKSPYSGSTGIIFSHMFKGDQTDWQHMAEEMAARGYMVLTYDLRGHGLSDGLLLKSLIVRDVRAALAFIKQQGATEYVMVGVDTSGMATVIVAAEEDPVAVILLSTPVAELITSKNRILLKDKELASIDAPKLLIVARDDLQPYSFGNVEGTNDIYEEMKYVYENMIEPVEMHVYKGSAHGTDLFDSEHGDDLRERLITFIETNAPLDQD